jgi:polyphosphate kinase 2 (PPK2 family)
VSKLDEADLTLTLTDKAYKKAIKAQMARLLELEQIVYERAVPVIVVFEGWDAAGKGTTIRRLTEKLDARGFKVLSTQAPRTHEKQRPWLWRFWMNIPRHGQIAIFDRSWYGRVLIERVEGLTPIPEWIRSYEAINAFERTLAADGTIFVKCWLHISKAEQLRRFLLLAHKPETAWQVAAEDWEHHRKYDEYLAAVEDMLENTDSAVAPWRVIPATDPNYRTFAVFRTLIEQLESALETTTSDWANAEHAVDQLAGTAAEVAHA